MRLTHIKLSGFKSFVDPTTIPTPSELVGVVGPNGCGKSNIIDAVRWVLGESRASELRGASMQDVIFNGSDQRKPAGRASVELVFDNSLGRAAGQWSSYAEISVRRVLTRDGASSYFINNQLVRRRDIFDIFLGTGLGSKGYAIIGQGMINRLIEARPEDLRVYLEEAAGVSRYKERRRETENRLNSTRENVTRLEDIMRELDTQLERLEQQAEVAQKYQDLQKSGELKQNALWLLREQAAKSERDKLAQQYEQEQLQLEKDLADLRAQQAQIEKIRADHFAANDVLHQAQGELFEAGSLVSKLEAEIKHVQDSRQRLGNRRSQLQAQIQQWQDQLDHSSQSIAEVHSQIADAETEAEILQEQVLQAQSGLPDLENELRDLSKQRELKRQELARVEQKLALAAQTQRDTDKHWQSLQERKGRLQQQDVTGQLDITAINQFEQDFNIAQAQHESAQENLLELESQQLVAEQQLNQTRQEHQDNQQEYDRLVAKEQALVALQEKIQGQDSLLPWLERQQLNGLSRLWQQLQVANPWVRALESVLNERMQAIGLRDLDSLYAFAADAPPVRLAFFEKQISSAYASDSAIKAPLLLEYVQYKDPELGPLLNYWLKNIYVADDLQQALALRHSLVAGAIVVPDGHLVDAHSVRFYAEDTEQAGLLQRQQQIANLQLQIKAARLQLEQSQSQCDQAIVANTKINTDLQSVRQQLNTLMRAEHQAQLQLQNARQEYEQAQISQQRLANDLAEITAQQAELRQQNEQAQMDFAAADEQVAVWQDEIATLDLQIESLAQQIEDSRAQTNQLDRSSQDAQFNVRSLHNRLNELNRNLNLAKEQIENSKLEMESLQGELFELDETAAAVSLQDALAIKLAKEESLRTSRIAQENLAAELRQADELRLKMEQALEPQRNKITDLQLKEQASRISIEQYTEQLEQKNVDRLELLSYIEQQQWHNVGWLQSEVQLINRKITALGAVNLAALDELRQARERKGFLDAQQADLLAAIDTLESAIRKIDRETRVLLKQTFDTVNQHFAELFPRLFGGGKSSLIMTGDEVLDAGVQVMAQPPGKRNSTINLLSGGEKALTAIALVFAFFKLNPAPFCLLDEVDAPLDDANTERYANLVSSMSDQTQFLFISHNKIAMQMAKQLIGVTMQEQGVSRIVAVDMDAALKMALP